MIQGVLGGGIYLGENTASNIINSPSVELLQLTRSTERKYFHVILLKSIGILKVIRVKDFSI